MTEPIIIFEDVSKHYPLYHHLTGGFKHFLFHLPQALKGLRKTRFEALRGISFTVQRGETFGLIGRNGAGKSTILGLMAGVLRPSSGQVAVKDRVVPLLELGSGFHRELTGRENIVLNGVLLGMRRRDVLRRMESIIEFSELSEFIDQPVRTYSSGMLSRLGFAVVANLEPPILLIDEVLAVGDRAFREKCRDRIRRFKSENVTIVLVSHAMEEICQHCDRAMWIEDHVARSVGTPRDVTAQYDGASLAAPGGRDGAP